MKNNYLTLQSKLQELLKLYEDLYNFCRKQFFNKNLSLIDRAYFWHISEIISGKATEWSEITQMISLFSEKDSEGKIQFLLDP